MPPSSDHEEIGRLRAAVAELRLLNDIAMQASGAGSSDDVLEMIIDRALTVINAEQGSILLVEGETPASLKTYMRQDNRSSLRTTYRVGTHITGSVVHNRKPLLIENLATDSRFEATAEERAEIHTVLCVPIIVLGRLIGVFMMTNKKGGRSFSREDQRLLMILSAQAGQLIANARLQEETRRKKEELAVARLETEKARELDEMKTRFFADISHEFRTPLSLILAPVEQLIARAGEEDPKADYMRIRHNARRLLRLISDILDLSRLDARSMKLGVEEGNLAQIVRSTVESFLPLAREKAVTVSVGLDEPDLCGVFDRETIETVLYNLIANALKFTPRGGTVRVTLAPVRETPSSPRSAELTVSDSGRGIPPAKLQSLFDRYFQVDETDRETGTGIGLALTRGLVELHHGMIRVTSSEGEGSSFTVNIPIDPASFTEAELRHDRRERPEQVTPGRVDTDAPPDDAPAGPHPAASDLPLMLIAEDDADMRRYLAEGFRKSYRIYEASDGDIGLSIARDVVPDIVISDVAMPVVDGVELCRNLKNDVRTCHIPVLLLTAVASRDTRMAGLETGADDYLAKPFEWPELATRVRNLVEGRKRLRHRFARTMFPPGPGARVASMDQVFLTHVTTAIEKSMGDEAYSVEALARDVAMSYSQLHRKLTALLGRSPNQLIRSMRLNRAKDLLERNTGTVSEISYMVGFGSPAYMTKCFREEFGIVPSDVQRNPARPPAES